MKKKNCHNCIHLEWIDDDSEIRNDSGWVCNNREYAAKHIEQLESESYRLAPKKCAKIEQAKRG